MMTNLQKTWFCKFPFKEYILKVDKCFNFKMNDMKKSTFSPEQIAKILKEVDQGKNVEELPRTYGVSRAAFYKWRQC